MLARLIDWYEAKLQGLMGSLGACHVLVLCSSDSHTEGQDAELVLDACDASSEKMEEVEEEAEEERAGA